MTIVNDFNILAEKEAAFNILVQKYKNPLTNFVFRFLGDYEACADVVQETMIKVYRYKDSYSSVAKFSTWVFYEVWIKRLHVFPADKPVVVLIRAR